jgi:ubiquinone/menaquinone biosynthesis C-methylase UbiE
MTHEMVALARRNAAKLGVDNVTFLLGQIEAVPLPDSSVDLVVSNCVLALAPDKDLVFQEIYRLLRPGGRLFISDVVTEVELPEQTRTDPEQWVSCIAGADLKSRYVERIQRAGFEDVALVTDSQFDSSCAEDGPDAWRASLRSVTVKAFRPGV